MRIAGTPLGRINGRALLLVFLASCAWSSQADAASQLSISSVSAGAFAADDASATQAGGHPFELRSSFSFGTILDADVGFQVPAAAVKDTVFDLPPGVVGNPEAAPQCRQQDMNDDPAFGNCPTETQIGYAEADIGFIAGRSVLKSPIYNMVPPPGEPAQFAFLIVGSITRIDVKVRDGGDYGVIATVHNTNTAVPIYGATVHLWGIPADPSHDALRFRPTSGVPGDINGDPLPSTSLRKPFLRNPTSCSGEVTTTLRATSWQQPNDVVTAEAHAPGITGCADVPFAPTIGITPDTRKAGDATGLGVDIDVPQNEDPDGLASADLRRVVMKLPAGITLNPGASDGLDGCKDTDFAIRSTEADACPGGSKLGTVTVTTPLLKEPLKGDVMLAAPLEQSPAAAANGRMFRLFLEAEGSGVRIKLAGTVAADPVTGQLTTTFDNNPQLPFSNLHLQLDGGPRAPLATPKACGTYRTTAALTPWSAPAAPTVDAESTFVIDQGCDQAGKFEPAFEAGLTTPLAGRSSAFVVNVARPSGQQDLKGLSVSLPPGVLAHIGSVPLCPEAQAATGTCATGSRIGHTTVASGVGSNPVYLPQAGKAPTAVYLAGPYKGAPYSLSIVVPAQAGPFDLGTVVVRAQLQVDPVDAHATVVSDPLPTMLLGVPLDVQKISVVVDRPGFMQNPTNCDPMQVAAKAGSATTVVDRTVPFQVTGCKALALKPKLTLALSGKNQTKDGAHPALAARLTMPAGNANLKGVKVTLPLSLALDPDNSQSDDLCEFEVGKQTIPACPARSIVGTATAVTPLLNVPLTGPVYFVKNVRVDPKSGRQIRTLPTLAIVLRGAGITLVLRATSDVVDNHLVTTFANVPDAPVSDFKLNINGGKKDILVVSGADLCKSTQVTEQVATGHNGKVAEDDITMDTPCALGIVASSHTASALKLTIGGLGAGVVSASGPGLTKTTKTLVEATTATLAVPLSAAVRGRLAQHRDVRIKVRVAFTPKGAKKARTATKTLTLHG